MTLKADEKLVLGEILQDLESYRPRRKGWTWRIPSTNGQAGPFRYRQISEPLKQSCGLPASRYFNHIDPQPDCVITTEIASGRFEDDIRRMRMAAWHGADHIMVIGDGRILEAGDHPSLMREKGRYYEMVISQMGKA